MVCVIAGLAVNAALLLLPSLFCEQGLYLVDQVRKTSVYPLLSY